MSRARGEPEPIAAGGEPDESASPPVLELIRDAIVSAEFVPDQRLVEADLSERFLASRSAVRFALMQLAAEGLVERIPHRGARVRAVSLDESIEIVEVRMAVEGLCAAKAAERVTEAETVELRAIGARMADAVATGDTLGYSEANRRLHRLIRDFSGQETAVRVLERLRAQRVHHHFGRGTNPERPATSLQEHRAIIDAICSHDPAAAELATRHHLASLLDALKALRARRSGAGSNGAPAPSQRARGLVRGAYDVNIRLAPDTASRGIDDIALASRFAEVGLAGFVLTSGYFPTAERAAAVRSAVPGIDAVGAITLNGSVGGMNPVAVELAGRSGARAVLLRAADTDGPEGVAADPIEVVAPGGQVLEATRQVLRVIADRDMTLVTGHLPPEETEAVVDAAVAAGVRRIVVTDPGPAAERLGIDRQRRLAAKGALLERSLAAPHTGRVPWGLVLEHIRAVGVAHSVLSSGLGAPSDPPVEDGLAMLADRLLAGGFTEEEIRLMAVRNTRWPAGADDRRAGT